MTWLLSALTVLVAGGGLALAAGRSPALANRLGVGSAVLGCGLGLLAAVEGLFAAAGPPLTFARSWAVPAGSFALTVDPLAAFFLLPVFLLALLCAVYGGEYLRGGRRLGGHWFCYNLLTASMALVVTAANAVLFLFAWEVMSLASFLLVASEHERPEVSSAAWLYLLATHLGTAALFTLFLFAGTRAESFDFAAFGALSGLPAGQAALLFFLALIGFGTKAGLFPLHVWLPEAHPAAPSHVSALMSGIMVKTGIYGVLRIVTFLAPAPAWWGGVLMALGIAGALFGIVLAALQRDAKRCLAYSTIENVGIIFLALGLGLFAAGRGLPGVAMVAAAGGLLHLWNHALFKGLLFLGAGSLLHATGTRDLDRMGGLLRRMPVTGGLLIGGCLAIAALPPLNGFASEWLLYLGLLGAGGAATGVAALYPLLLAGLLALTGALALLVFTRLAGVALLGQPRTAQAASAHEPGAAMTLPMAVLLLLCLAVGLFPAQLLHVVAFPAAQLVPGIEVVPVAGPAVAVSRGALGLLALLASFWAGLRWFTARGPAVAGATWGCGFAFPSSRMSYSAEGYAELAHRHLLPRRIGPEVAGGKPSGLFPGPATLRQEAPDPALERLFRPIFFRLAERCWRLRWLQLGRLHIYLLYIFVTCAALMSWIVLAERGWP
jgi:formate hydrogenlyase subunit 3/multisubunit Na+/H+ antiporter MnhD subunit